VGVRGRSWRFGADAPRRALAAVALACALSCGGELKQGLVYTPVHGANAAPPRPPTRAASSGAPAGAAQAGDTPSTRVGEPPPIAPPGETPLWTPVPIVDPSARALAAFHAALQRAERGEGQARIVFYGASHTADDMYTGPLRQRLQLRFGESGLGFVALGKPWKWYRHAGIKIESSRGFREFRIRAKAPEAGIYGLSGVALDAGFAKPARSVLQTKPHGGLSGKASSLEVFYLEQPNGGHFSLFVDGARVRRVATNARTAQPAYLPVALPDALHRIDLRTEGDGRVRVFGAALERDVPGVILDTLGVPGTRARDHLFWDDAVYREHLARRKPDLLVFAYGTNESGDDDVPVAMYEEQLRKVLLRAREVAVGASCLLIGPSDRPLLDEEHGTYGPRPLTDAVIDVQRRVAAELGCGFFDVSAFMGGQLSMLRWATAVPPLGSRDFVHFTAAGYAKLADVLHDALLAGYVPALPTGEAAPVALSSGP
jgi:lysophospholipase L1-like esterase